ncbi:peptidase associated/transthyretin-like domain-containing protein [Taibaiella koreensis]|uniref:carboxypeptidase-like regulatory domain-containing protein n=1 Tax=Taibaiella koreensis TaxID=1268548 RepID=UPI0013C362E4|nr:carboxypeptidase-like regulatory domain-containing protein [Taibaiella koreensis]
MKYLGIIIAIIATLLFASCGKTAFVSPKPSQADTCTGLKHLKGREDDDGPLIMHIVADAFGKPLARVQVSMSNGGETYQEFTDEYGQCFFHLSWYGDYKEQFFKEGYQRLDTMITLTDSSTVQMITLQQ